MICPYCELKTDNEGFCDNPLCFYYQSKEEPGEGPPSKRRKDKFSRCVSCKGQLDARGYCPNLKCTLGG
jgi:hypothetical protein